MEQLEVCLNIGLSFLPPFLNAYSPPCSFLSYYIREASHRERHAPFNKALYDQKEMQQELMEQLHLGLHCLVSTSRLVPLSFLFFLILLDVFIVAYMTCKDREPLRLAGSLYPRASKTRWRCGDADEAAACRLHCCLISTSRLVRFWMFIILAPRYTCDYTYVNLHCLTSSV
jgi:hypothetical protein